ncbi:hypothetical protein [Aedoeadaptatus coxii]|uniref:hypothetical protein n=1 Tax=Aedoeadaptatus coxii TaxID=755172 RepID=UPI002AD47056|nr:hypothetical protein [Peptoniphilus coxii]
MRIGIIKDKFRIDKGSENHIKEREQDKVARSIENALKDRYDVIDYIFDDTLGEKLREDKIDLAFILAKGNVNPDDVGELPALLNSLDIPFAGSNAMGQGIASDRGLMTGILSRNHIPHPTMWLAENPVALAGLSPAYPLVVMNASEGILSQSGDGALVLNEEELLEEATPRLLEGEELLLMEGIEGEDVLFSVLGNGDEKTVLPPLVLVEDPDGEGICATPADLQDTHMNEAKALAAKVFDLLQMRDYAVVAMRVNEEKAYVYGLKSAVDFHPEGLFAAAAKEGGIGYDELIQTIVDIAVKREGLRDDGKKGDVDGIRAKRHEEQEEARVKAQSAYRRRFDQEAKRAFDDFQREAKRKSAEYKAMASEEMDRLKENAQSAAKEGEAKAYELRDRAENKASELRESAEAAAWEMKNQGEDIKRRAAQKRDDVVESLIRYAEEEEEREKDAPEIRDEAVYGVAKEDGADARYRALERRVHALEERLRLLENR